MDNLSFQQEFIPAPPNPSEQIEQLENELQTVKRELANVRKDLAAKTVQLSRKEAVVFSDNSDVVLEKDRQLQLLSSQLAQMEQHLAQRDEELEELRRLYYAQKKAVKDALEAAAEREASKRADDEAGRSAVEDLVTEEIDRLQQQLAQMQARSQLELASKDGELQILRAQLATAAEARQSAVAASEAALVEAWQAEVERTRVGAELQLMELQDEVIRLRTQMDEQQRHAEQDIPREMAALNNAKVQVQREFEAYREMTSAAARQNREELAKLLQENATLRTRLAQQHAKEATHVDVPRVFESQASTSGSDGWGSQYLKAIEHYDRQRRGMLPALAVGAVVLLVLLFAVLRAAASASGEHPLACFLARLGINIGAGCSPRPISGAGIEKVLEDTPRVHDVQTVLPQPGGGRRLSSWGF